MGIQINGQNDNISATDGGLTISDLEINQSGISTFNGSVIINEKIRINPDDASTTWQRENKHLHQIRDDVYVEGTVNLGDKAGFDATPLGITTFAYTGIGTTGELTVGIATTTHTPTAHAIAEGKNILIKDSASGFQEAYNTLTGSTGLTIKVRRAEDPSTQLSIANTKVVVYTPADPRGCLNVAKDFAKFEQNTFNPILRGFVGASTTHPVGINTEVFKIELKRDSSTQDSVATLLHSTREMGSKQRLALTIDDGDSYPDGKSLVLTQTGVKITNLDDFSNTNELLEVEGNAVVTIGAGGTSTVGIGTTNATQALDVRGASSVAIKVESHAAQYSEVQINNSSKNYTLGVRPDISHGFAIRDASAGTNRLIIDSSGRLLVNTTTGFAGDNTMIIAGESPSGGTYDLYDGQLLLTSTETSGAVNTGGVIQFYGHDGGSSRGFGSIRCLKENGTSGNHDAYMAFLLRQNGANPAERLRIKSDGHVIIDEQLGIGGVDPGGSTLKVNGSLVLSQGGNTSWQKVSLEGSGSTSGDVLSINNWGDAEGDYWGFMVNQTMNQSGNYSKTNSGKRTSFINLDGRMGRVYLGGASTSGNPTEHFYTNWDGSIYMNAGFGSVAPFYGVRAWVQGSGSGSANGSGGLSSVSRPSTGRFLLTFATTMPDTNYAIGCLGNNNYSDTSWHNNEGTDNVSVYFYSNGSYQNPSKWSAWVMR